VGLISLSSVRSRSTPCSHDWGTLRCQDNASECERQNWHFHSLFRIVGNGVAASTAHLRFMALYILFRQFSFSLSFYIFRRHDWSLTVISSGSLLLSIRFLPPFLPFVSFAALLESVASVIYSFLLFVRHDCFSENR